MTKLEKLISEHVGENDILINVNKYNGAYETEHLAVGTKVFYVTRKVNNKTSLLIEGEITDRAENCLKCPIADYSCNSIACNMKIIKIYRV